ncbi:ABC transporter permease [Mucilaginibacter gotjawali]|uniref:ABC-2 type transport system permease protein n=2 Tax=Mucilaginibacter gotjawali TaxID=1550579 RepID=A0A839SFQ8_9SPHI|nr:ABC transporter permease [Mucilaginibacter gotjawali]MBB3056388.1 ABC-2 type transport system permease protein [Mucilaginibacter gotjawali]BAU55095.1 Inner membrane transport permease YbhR [Mucilaginibacter gotjawali]
MRMLKFLLQKELKQIFRDPGIIRVLFIMPMVQLLILPLAADYEIKNINLGVVDQDHTEYSRILTNKIIASGYFKLKDYSPTFNQGLKAIELDKTDLIVEIPPHFERDLVKDNQATLFIAVNAINGVKAGLGGAYVQQIIQGYNQNVRMKWIQAPRYSPQPTIDVTYSDWYNPHMNYKVFMVPGILVMLVTMIGSSFAANNIVREKELGTIEQINVSPIKKWQFILGKLIPFWMLALSVLTLGLIIARVVYGIIPLGSYFTIYIFASIYLLAVLGLGLLLSTYAQTQQQSMLVSFFVTMIFNLLSGLYTPIESMPTWAQWITKFNPVSYFIEVMRMVMLKGSGLTDIRFHIVAILGFALFFNGWAVLNYRKRTG